jgi:hypothetical protein
VTTAAIASGEQPSLPPSADTEARDPLSLASLQRITRHKRLQLALGVQGLPLGVDEVALQAADHHLVQLLLVGQDVSCEALVVQQFKQRGE